MAIEEPKDPVLRRRVVRLQYIAVALWPLGVLRFVMIEQMGGSAMEGMVVGTVRTGTIERTISPGAWWTLLGVECIGLLAITGFLAVFVWIFFLLNAPAKPEGPAPPR